MTNSMDILRRNVASDTPFRRRMRLHQAWWRDKHGLPFGSDGEGELGSLISKEAADEGRNFLTPEIALLARRANSRHVDKKRLAENLLSSQPMAFNLFGPLAVDPELARVLLTPLLGKPVYVASVEIEVTPPVKADHLEDETSFDAFVRYASTDGTIGAIAIETKLSESFSPVTAATNADRAIYRRVSVESGLYKDPMDSGLATSDHWQMWRNQLLLHKYAQNTCDAVMEKQAWVIHHQDDEAGNRAVGSYKSLLADSDKSFRQLTLTEVVGAWQNVVLPSWAPWLEAFRERYVDLGGSAHLG